MLTGKRPDALVDARVRRRAGPARRSRAQRVDVCRPRRRGDADRHPLRDRRRDRRAEGPAPRRRQRRRDAAAARDRPGRVARARRRGDPRQARAQGEDSGLRPPRLPHRGSARDAPAPDVARSSGKRAGNTALVRDVAAHRAARQGEKKLYPNVDFYSASTYYTLGIPIDLFTPIFAVSRISGWTAHCLEQYANNRLIRPRTDYIGPQYPQRFLPLDQR